MERQFTIGTFDFVRYLGKGGMAAVWEARHRKLNQGRLAIKFLLDEYAINRDLQDRFLDEAKIQYELHHPNIVRVRDFFEADGRSYMVMEYVEPPLREGVTEEANAFPMNLEARLQSSPALSLAEIYRLSNDVLNALQFAHEHPLHVVHRDVKPSNIMLSRDGRAVLTDFGIAKILGNAEPSAMTRTIIGTPDYMSPEQITDPRKINPCSDIYGFGCVLYAMLNGSPPFAGQATTDFGIQSCHVNHPPPPLVEKSVPISPALREFVSKCLQKDQVNRFQSCAEAAEALKLAMYPPAKPAAQTKPELPILPPVVVSPPTIKVEPPPSVAWKPKPEPPAAPQPVVAPLEKEAEVKLDPPPPRSVTPQPRSLPAQSSKPWMMIGVAAVVLLALVGGYFVMKGHSTANGNPPASNNAVAPDNQAPPSPRTDSPPPDKPNDGTTKTTVISPGLRPGQKLVKPPAAIDPVDCCDDGNLTKCNAARVKAGDPKCNTFVNNN